MISRQSKLFFSTVAILLVASCIVVFNQYVIKEDFYVFTNEEFVPSASFSELKEIHNRNIFNQEGITLWNN